MDKRKRVTLRQCSAVLGLGGVLASQGALAQSVFDTGANSLVGWALTIASPIAVILVIVAGGAAAIGRISWGWVIGGLIGIAAIFGSEQIVGWIRDLFGV